MASRECAEAYRIVCRLCVIAGLVLVMVVSCLTGLTLSADYCDPLLCQTGRLHIGCNATDTFGDACPPNTVVVPVDDKLRDMILDLHNSLRSELASGKMEGFESAERMAVLVSYEGMGF